MSKWADYLISAVKYTTVGTAKHISQVKVHNDNGDSVGLETIWSRHQVISVIDKSTFMTITKGSDGKWNKGALVEKIYEFGDWYIKTKADSTKNDNLGSLPEF